MAIKLFTAIALPGGIKYRNIPQNKVSKFEDFIFKKFPDVLYFNMYDKESRGYMGRVYKNKNHEINVFCKSCGVEYDARMHIICPSCGSR
jgi:hypothetical protein